MKLKLDDAGNAVLLDGKPVYVHDDGKEAPFDVPDLYAKLLRDGKTITELRAKNTALEQKAQAWGETDPEEARKALETVKSIKDGELIQAGKADEIKAAAKKAAEDSVAAAAKAHAKALEAATIERDRYKALLNAEKIGNAFARSKFIADKIAVPVDLLQDKFGSKFTVEDDGRMVAKGADGHPIPSRARFGENADFEEAIEVLVNEYPHKDHILKGAAGPGGGARPGVGTGLGGQDLSKLPPVERMNRAREAQASK